MTTDQADKKKEEEKNTSPNNGEDDDEEDDEDYNPDEEKDQDEENEEQIATTQDDEPRLPTCNLSHSKILLVDEAFESMFGYKYGTRFVPLNNKKRKRLEPPRSLYKEEEVLESLFGPVSASRMMKTRHYAIKSMKETCTRNISKEEEMVTELKHYAGKIIKVQSKKTHVEKDQSKGIDSLLQELNGPSKLSTVAKTSSDWDTFKTDTGMEEELEQKAQGKEAYLHKQDFLNRVDHRRFAEEKQKRDDERRKRGK
eukprot:CAMPEP_0194250938 /NCGR_PEP_ID=MMETSP0158-20130606/24186_1 /TAXON_ID=33649 /ORGANISM="Thalassionema nitzschioides, Strain L26-B" /LENGTH=254 /DNA_ID=CAMNT_0038987895 /DNA_START=12 /DNA_END=776 /DNA_ORIENTATION=+